jgi:hypothetical protein
VEPEDPEAFFNTHGIRYLMLPVSEYDFLRERIRSLEKELEDCRQIIRLLEGSPPKSLVPELRPQPYPGGGFGVQDSLPGFEGLEHC